MVNSSKSHQNGVVMPKFRLSERVVPLLQAEDGFLGKYLNLCINSPWSIDSNKNGYINMGTAENFLCDEILTKKLNEPNLSKFEARKLRYYTFHGNDGCRRSTAKFITRYFKANFLMDPEKLMMVSGTSSIFDMLAHIIADPGDCFLCPAPYYTCIKSEIFKRSLIDLETINMVSQDDQGPKISFGLTLEAVVKTYEKAIKYGRTVKAIILVNPNNPLGSIISKEDLIALLEFATTKGLYVLMDEIYALSVFGGESDSFRSVLSFWNEFSFTANIIWIWGLSKDFCNPGLRVSFFYNENENLIKAAKRLSVFQTVPHHVHYMIENLLSDFDWLDKVYFPNNRKSLLSHCCILESWLNKLGIDYCKPKAGLFIFANFSTYLPEKTEDAEKKLFDEFLAEKVYIVPGHALFCTNFGWYRILFSVKPQMLNEGLLRIEKVLARRLRRDENR